MREGRFLRIGGYLRRRADAVRHRRHRSRDLWIRVHPRPHRARNDHVRSRDRSGRARARRAVGRRAGGHWEKGARDGRDHARTHAREHRRADLRRDGPLSVRRESDRPGWDERRGRGREGRERRADLEQRRNIWVTETALATALDMGFMSEMLSIFSIIVGVALLLTGIGLVILAKAVFGRGSPGTRAAPTAPE